MAYAGPIAEGERVTEPLRRFGNPALDIVAPRPSTGLQTMIDDTAPHGINSYDRGRWLAELPDPAIETMVELFAEVPSPMSLLLNARMGAAVERVPKEATAFGHRDAHRLLWIIGQWFDGDLDEQRAWSERVYKATGPYSTGAVYVNQLGDEGAERVRAAYDDAVWRRLVDAKRRWDPDNVFHLNQNIDPTDGASR